MNSSIPICRNCNSRKLIETTESLVCKNCGVINNFFFNPHAYRPMGEGVVSQFDRTGGANEQLGDFLTVGSNFKDNAWKKPQYFVHFSNNVSREALPAHQRKANDVIKRTETIIDQIDEFKKNEIRRNSVLDKCKVIIEKLCLERVMSDDFSLPKDTRVLCACSIILACQYVREINGGIPQSTVVKVINPDKLDKFNKSLYRFYTSIQRNSELRSSFNVNNNYESNQYIQMVHEICIRLDFPYISMKIISDLVNKATKEVWLGGKNPKNIVGSCFVHLIYDCEEYNDDKNFKKIIDRIDRSSMIFALSEMLGIKEKVITECTTYIKEKHKC